jgi:hypothetical protein
MIAGKTYENRGFLIQDWATETNQRKFDQKPIFWPIVKITIGQNLFFT